MASDTELLESQSETITFDDPPPAPAQREPTPTPEPTGTMEPVDIADVDPDVSPDAADIADVDAPQASEPTATDSQADWIRDTAERYGVDLTGITNERDAIQYLASTLRQYQGVAQEYQQVQPYLPKVYEMLAAEQKQPQQQQQQAKPGWFNPPVAFEPEFDQMQRDPKSGALFFTDGTPVPPDMAARAERYRRYEAMRGRELIRNPESVFGTVREQVLSEVREQVLGEVQQMLAQQEQARALEATAFSLRDKYAAKDAAGKMLVRNGRVVLTPEGEAVGKYVKHLEQTGMTDANAIASLAERLAEHDRMKAEADARSRDSNGKERFRANAIAHTSNRGGAGVPKREVPKSLSDLLMANPDFVVE